METVANFSINYTQFLNAAGEEISTLPAFAHDRKLVLSLYRWMVLLRTFDTKAIALQRTGKIGTYPSTLGQEAISVGIGNAMHASDVLCPYYREYGAQLQRGVTMTQLLQYWGGDERGNDYARDKPCANDFPICVPIASQCLHAAGVAIAFKLRNEARVAVTVCGDGATSKGDFYEALNLAGAWQLPLVFIINNNQWAISVPRQQQTHAQTLAQKAIAAGIPCEQIDGNDVIAVRHACQLAIEKARQQQGPHVIEALTYRLCDHTTADDANRYRDKFDLEKAWQQEPIQRLRLWLIQQGFWSSTDETQLLTDCTQQVEQAVQEYLKTPAQGLSAIFDYHYHHLPRSLQEQRDIAIQGWSHG
jgi:2-oxoisovalerate dehydrogenase E1 component alpha subunit